MVASLFTTKSTINNNSNNYKATYSSVCPVSVITVTLCCFT